MLLEQKHENKLSTRYEPDPYMVRNKIGNQVIMEGIAPEEIKVEAVLNAKEPENASEVRSFLGLVNLSERFIPDLATVVEPLRRLTKKNVEFKWVSEQKKS